MSDALTIGGVAARRAGTLERATTRWSQLAYASAVAFVVMLYSNPMYWWPSLERLRLAFVTMAACGAAVIAHRLTSGARLRLGGAMGAPLLVYLAMFPASLLWTIQVPDTEYALFEALKMGVVYVGVQNALDRPARLRAFLLIGALASLGPALGGVWIWWRGDALVEGFRTHWRGLYGDPNRLAMSLVALLPAALYGAVTARRPARRALFVGVAGAQVAAIVLTHSRSGAVAMAVASALFLVRGRRKLAQAAMAALLLAGVIGFAPSSFWARSSTITQFETDASVEGRRHAWMVLDNIVAERPFTGVGAGAFLASWARYAPLEAGGKRYVAHNVLLETIGELGVVAFALLALFVAILLYRLWRAGSDPIVGPEARALFAGLSGYLVCEMVNGYALSWFLYFLFGASAAAIHLAALRRAALKSDHDS
jgi:O-antigen ligase